MSDDVEAARKKDAHIWTRHPQDWYVEPEWVSRRLFDVEAFNGAIVNPACGMGRIIKSARQAGFVASGFDLAIRGEYTASEQDFLANFAPCDNIISNPPFGIADRFVAHALNGCRAQGRDASPDEMDEQRKAWRLAGDDAV